ncbi:Hypothetical predicted protein [Xyrichtys novacula]|uniref:Uncharacterized protein n=1 Tax=Xyrichtys novacula TaxID=13765 RepID=A0AAV1FUW3_XYRNO|nr:Hypothetical predicted protein [Xyrichtys novacula]
MGRLVADQIYWRGHVVIKQGQRTEREMLRLGNGAIYGPITQRSAREKQEEGKKDCNRDEGGRGGGEEGGQYAVALS